MATEISGGIFIRPRLLPSENLCCVLYSLLPCFLHSSCEYLDTVDVLGRTARSFSCCGLITTVILGRGNCCREIINVINGGGAAPLFPLNRCQTINGRAAGRRGSPFLSTEDR